MLVLIWKPERCYCWGCFVGKTVFELLFWLIFGAFFLFSRSEEEIVLLFERFFPASRIHESFRCLQIFRPLICVAAHFSEFYRGKLFVIDSQQLLAHNLNWVSLFDNHLTEGALILFINLRAKDKIFWKTILIIWGEKRIRILDFGHLLVFGSTEH